MHLYEITHDYFYSNKSQNSKVQFINVASKTWFY
jgi:hypothetical protein